MIKSFLDLEVYQESFQLSLEVEEVIRKYPKEEKFLRDALAEANEAINHLTFAKAKKYLTVSLADNLIERYSIVGKKLFKLKENWQSY